MKHSTYRMTYFELAGEESLLKSTPWMWGSVGIVALLSTCLFIFGLVYAVKDILHPQPAGGPAQSPPSKAEEANTPLSQSEIHIVALGDSLTKGTGDESGKGYVMNVKEQLEQITGKPVYVKGNFGVNGYRTDQLLHDLQTKSAVVDTLSKANLIMLTIGGNDLFQLARTELNLAADIDPAALLKRLPEATGRLEQILTTLAEINPEASIVYIGLYNPFLDLDETGQSSLIIQQFNHEAFEVANRFPNMTLVPTYDLFQLNHGKYIYSDHFHPNRFGYERMAERIVQALQ
jgi:lysophospholipase L1-like esterase